MIFWITASALALVAFAILARAVLRRRDTEEHPAAFDLQVYRDQLKEVDRELARGLINDGDRDAFVVRLVFADQVGREKAGIFAFRRQEQGHLGILSQGVVQLGDGRLARGPRRVGHPRASA